MDPQLKDNTIIHKIDKMLHNYKFDEIEENKQYIESLPI